MCNTEYIKYKICILFWLAPSGTLDNSFVNFRLWKFAPIHMRNLSHIYRYNYKQNNWSKFLYRHLSYIINFRISFYSIFAFNIFVEEIDIFDIVPIDIIYNFFRSLNWVPYSSNSCTLISFSIRPQEKLLLLNNLFKQFCNDILKTPEFTPI